MLRSAYERNKDKLPYSRFEVYDPHKGYETYTTHGSETYGAGVNSLTLAFGAGAGTGAAAH